MAASTFETLPAEILHEIFRWSCWDEIDLVLLATSRRVRDVLVQHPIARVLSVLAIEKHKKQIRVVSRPEVSEEKSGTVTSRFLSATRHETIKDLVGKPWCTHALILRIQIALINRLLRVYWRPLLYRDGSSQSSWMSSDIPRNIRWSFYDPVRSGDVSFTLTGAADRYPWTRVQVWPVLGRVLVRDQLLNEWWELTICLLGLLAPGE